MKIDITARNRYLHGCEKAEAIRIGLHIVGVHLVVSERSQSGGVGDVEDAFDARASEGDDHIANAVGVHGGQPGWDVGEASDDVCAYGLCGLLVISVWGVGQGFV